MDDAGEFSVLFQPLRFIPVALGGKAVTARGAQDVSCIRAIPRNAAVQTHLLQRDPLAVVGEDHCKACGTAFQRLHLHDDGHPGDPRCDGGLYFL